MATWPGRTSPGFDFRLAFILYFPKKDKFRCRIWRTRCHCCLFTYKCVVEGLELSSQQLCVRPLVHRPSFTTCSDEQLSWNTVSLLFFYCSFNSSKLNWSYQCIGHYNGSLPAWQTVELLVSVQGERIIKNILIQIICLQSGYAWINPGIVFEAFWSRYLLVLLKFEGYFVTGLNKHKSKMCIANKRKMSWFAQSETLQKNVLQKWSNTGT